MITQQTIQQILARIDIIDIVGSFVRLKKRGSNYLGLCPFHNEKTPSFTVSPSKEIYKCFGCGRSGNTIGFLMEHEKYSYVEALKWLAAKYNIEIEETSSNPELRLQQQLADSLFIINSFAQQYFSDAIFRYDEGQDIAAAYLKERGFRDEIIKKFQLGYCLDKRDAFATAALAAQYNAEYLQKAGLVVLRDGQLMDNYRGRIIFPVHNQTGKIIGFGARTIKKNDKSPKYINTPENEIYIKSRILYGLYFARRAVDYNDECLLVEGYTDVISMHQAGIENVVASGGTSLTQEQLRLIRKYTSNLTIIYDGDAAGVKAALRGLDMAVEEGLSVRLVLIPNGEDPDSFIQKSGVAAFRKFVLENKKDFILFQLDISAKEAGLDSKKKADVVNQVAETIAKINKAEDFTLQQDYIRKCAERLQIDEQGLHNLVNQFIKEKVQKEELRKTGAAESRDKNITEKQVDFSDEAFNVMYQDELQERALVRVLLNYGSKEFDGSQTVADYIFLENLDEETFKNEKIHELLLLYKQKYESEKKLTTADFTYLPDNEIVRLVINTTNHPYELSARWNDEDRARTINSKIWEYNYEDFKRQVFQAENAAEVIYSRTVDDNYRSEVEDVMIYLKLKKIKRLIVLNEEDLKNMNADQETIKHYQEVHIHLKALQKELTLRKRTVIYPF
ncbi:MAG TPA: DNA primase [Puia sp.]|nr:DNA primase [Puia sp.]